MRPHDPDLQTVEPTASSQPASARSEDAFASPSQVRWLVFGLVVMLGLFGLEITHYAIATDLGATDHMEASATIHPQCKELGSRYDLSCPFVGYNSVQLRCVVDACGVLDPSRPALDDRSRAEAQTSVEEDAFASLAVEAPYSGADAAWRMRASQLGGGKQDLPPEIDVDKPPQTLDQMSRIVQERNLLLSHEAAEEWLLQHGR